MASLQLHIQPREQFNFSEPDGWLKWKRHYEQYCAASGLTEESDTRQVSTLLYCLGEEANDVLSSTNITEEERKVYKTVVEKFDNFFQVRRNVIFEQACFNQRWQLPSESAEKYISALYSLVEHCNYGDLKDEMIRDRLVVGIQDQKLSQQLQLDAGLTLEKAKKAIRQKEAIREQGQELEGGSKVKPEPIEELKLQVAALEVKLQGHQQSHRSQRSHWPRRSPLPKRGGASGRSCTRCGHNQHQRGEKCPASDVTCHHCGNVGHYHSQCLFQKKESIASVDTAFLDSLNGPSKSAWTAVISVGNSEVSFKLDTGAGVTAISEDTFKFLNSTELRETSRKLFGPARQELNVLGQFTAQLIYQKNSAQEDIYVVKGLKTDLLGLPAIISLHLIERLCGTDDMENQSEIIKQKFPKVFNGLGTMGSEYEIRLKENSTPYAIFAPRNVPIPLRPKVQEELSRMEKIGVIEKVFDPTSWCAGMVVVPKKSGNIRICVDLKHLNESVLREVHPIPKNDNILAELGGAKVFSRLDANSGFWQIPLSQKSKHLTTFLTPFGRYCFTKLPFGISSAPEVYQRRMHQIIEGLPGVADLIDDLLIQAEHDARLEAVLARLEKHNVTLNSEKCAFSQKEVKFLGHIVDQHGVRADPDKTAAIMKMDSPKSITDLRRFMGMVNQLGKFSSRIADISQPLRSLLSSKNAWVWGPDQDNAFSQIKEELVKPTVLALYDPQLKTKISADASSFGLGAVLLQQHQDEWKPVAYASRALSETERRYAQIEKEALAVTWSCEKFSDYILGLPPIIESDHKPLIPLMNTKCLNSLPPRVLKFRLRLSRFMYTVCHVPGKMLYTADTLSRAPSFPAEDDDDIEAFLLSVTIPSLPASADRLDAYRKAQEEDPVCRLVIEYCKTGWPRKESPRSYWKVRGNLSICDDLLLFNNRIVVPKKQQKETLDKIHEGHQGMERSQMRARSAVWWPGISHQLIQRVRHCRVCSKMAKPVKEPLLVTSLPDYPWQNSGG